MAISTRISRNQATPSAQSPSMGARPLKLEAEFGEELTGVMVVGEKMTFSLMVRWLRNIKT